MEIKTSELIADHITERLFDLGSEVFTPAGQIEKCRRIQFVCGPYSNEKYSGGLNRDAFRSWLIEELKSVPDKLEG